MAMNGSFIIDPIMYPVHFFVSVGQDFEIMKSDFKASYPNHEHGFKGGELDETCDGLTRLLNNVNVVMVIFSKENPEVSHIVHELFHATSAYMRRIGMPHGRKSEEAYAYLIGFLTEKFFEQYNSQSQIIQV
jgi:hypothetical protein